MTIHWEPKVGARPVVATPETAQPRGRGTAPINHPPEEAISRPVALPQPQTAQLHPLKSHAAPHAKGLDNEVHALMAGLTTGSPTARKHQGEQALALAASYRLRRSRGACALATELCDAVAEHLPELANTASTLKRILTAEGELHDTSAASTLAGCRHLIELLEAEADEHA